MKKYISASTLKRIVRYALGIIFIASGVTKLFDHDILVNQVIYTLDVSYTAAVSFSYILSVIECALGTALMLKPNRKLLYVIIGMLSVFIVFLSYKVYIQDTSSCGCFGNFIKFSNRQELANDLVLLLGTIYLT